MPRVVWGKGGPAEGMSFRVYAEANDPQLGPTMWGATTRRAVCRGDLWSPACLRIHQPVGRDDLGAPSTCRGAPRGRACAAHPYGRDFIFRTRRSAMPNGIIIIDKPRDWTSVDVCIPQTHASAGTL